MILLVLAFALIAFIVAVANAILWMIGDYSMWILALHGALTGAVVAMVIRRLLTAVKR